jgi:DNA-binding MarR family transcriptional regulator
MTNDAAQADPRHPGQMLDLVQHPGHLLRRAQQISVSIFYDEMGARTDAGAVCDAEPPGPHPGIDQVSLAGLAAIDTSTGATVCARLEEKGLLERKVIPHNRRQRALTITREGKRLLDGLEAGAQRLRQRLLAPLSAQEQVLFMDLLASWCARTMNRAGRRWRCRTDSDAGRVQRRPAPPGRCR